MEPWGSDPVDTPLVSPLLEIEVLHHIKGNVDRFNDRAAHVQGIKRAIRSVHKIHRPEPVVGRADKFRPLLLRSTDRLERGSIGNQDPPMDQIVLSIADEGIPVILCGVGTPR